ncbi:hypothetical protein Tco_0513382 [Tanacetum coccineum]
MEVDHIENAKTSYIERYGNKRFQYVHAWNILKSYLKWDAMQPIDKDNLAEIFGPDPRVRPGGKPWLVKKQKSVDRSSAVGATGWSTMINRVPDNGGLLISVLSTKCLTLRAQSWVLQDRILRDSGICGMDDDLACLRDTISNFDFSGFTNKDTVPSKAQQTLANGFSSEMDKDMEVHFDMTIRQKTVFECLRAPHAHDFLLAIPIDGLGQHMSPVEYRTILKYRLMISLFPVDAICPVCRKACLDSFGEHAVHCKELPGFKYRHDMVKDVLFDICRRVGISAKKEAPVNFLTDPSDGRSTLKQADVLVFGWVGGKHACVDLTGVSLLVGLSSRGFTAGQAALKAASGKVTKHEKACIENQHVFIPFAFDTFGFLAPEAVEPLSRVQRVMHINGELKAYAVTLLKRIWKFSMTMNIGARAAVHIFNRIRELEADAVILLKWIRKFSMAQDIGARAAVHIFNMISFAIAKGVGAQIISRLPSNLL